MEIRKWEPKTSAAALHETPELKSQRLQLHEANQRADQAQREKINLRGKQRMRNRIYQECHTRTCQEIEELRRICHEETDRARQARIVELSLHQGRNPTTVIQLLTQLQIYSINFILCQMQRIFTILRQRTALEQPTFPVNPLLFRVPGPCLAAILDCRTTHGTSWVLLQTFVKAYLLEKIHPQLPSKIRGTWHHLLKN